MSSSQGLLTFSFPMGVFFGTRWRISFLLPIACLAVLWRLQDPALGLLAAAVLALSLVAHELGHLVASRLSGGKTSEVLLWPLGSLTHHAVEGNAASLLRVTLAGPAVSLAAVCAMLPFLSSEPILALMWNPFAGFPLVDGEAVPMTAARIAFFVNWCLVCFNLLPVLPLDVGRLMHSLLCLRIPHAKSRDLMLRSGMGFCLFGLSVGFVFDISSLAALFAFLLLLHVQESIQRPPALPAPSRQETETFLGYDFSEGYSSLARSIPQDREDDDSPRGSGGWSRSAADSGYGHARRDQEARLEDERQLDRILMKLHEGGRASLSAAELTILERASARLRERQTGDA